VSGDAFGEKHYMRLSFAASEQDIREGVARLKKGLASLA
jgi:aspartate/methionine/tyrosine aminotransferase